MGTWKAWKEEDGEEYEKHEYRSLFWMVKALDDSGDLPNISLISYKHYLRDRSERNTDDEEG